MRFRACFRQRLARSLPLPKQAANKGAVCMLQTLRRTRFATVRQSLVDSRIRRFERFTSQVGRPHNLADCSKGLVGRPNSLIDASATLVAASTRELRSPTSLVDARSSQLRSRSRLLRSRSCLHDARSCLQRPRSSLQRPRSLKLH